MNVRTRGDVSVANIQALPEAASKPAFRCEAVTPDAPAPVRHTDLIPSCSCALHGAGSTVSAYRPNPAFVGARAALEVNVPAKETRQRLEPKLPELVAMYKDIHQNPELSMTEKRTSAIVAKRLRDLGYEVTENFGKYESGAQAYGVFGVLKNGPGPTILLRADMDALPIVEETGLPYASKVKVRRPDGSEVGVMHACGHDMHITMLMGTAQLMAELKDRWSGTLVILGQPSEELLNGARAVMREGFYDKIGKPDFALALHVAGDLPAGQVASRPGYALANIDNVNVTMRGRGSHGSRPWESIDPILLGSSFVVEAQSVVSRHVKAGSPAVLTVGAFNGGTTNNVIPDEAKLKLTLRSYDPTVRKELIDGVTRTAKGVAVVQGVPPERDPIVDHLKHESIDATYNNPELTERVLDLWNREIGDVGVIEPRLGGEDFSIYSGPNHEIPALFAVVGVTDPKLIEESRRTGKPVPGTHSSKLAPIPEVSMRGGITAMVTAATALFGKRR